MKEPQLTKKCGFNDCDMQVPLDIEACPNCCFKLHVEIRRLQGISREDARIEWERSDGTFNN